MAILIMILCELRKLMCVNVLQGHWHMCVLNYKDELQMWHVDTNIKLVGDTIKWDDIHSKQTSQVDTSLESRRLKIGKR